MSKTYRWVSPLSWTLLGAALGTAGTLGAADDRQLAQLAARVSALERALVVTAGAVELRGPGTSLKLESGTARLRAPARGTTGWKWPLMSGPCPAAAIWRSVTAPSRTST